MIKDWSKATTYFGVGAVGLGFLLVFLAWSGAAGLDYTQGQIPYLISGGVGGLGLVIVGVVVLVVQNARRDRAEIVRELQRLNSALGGLTGAQGTANGRVVPAGRYVAGSSTFHLPTCRLVQGRSEAAVVTIEEAEERGLEPCRVCRPSPADKGADRRADREADAEPGGEKRAPTRARRARPKRKA